MAVKLVFLGRLEDLAGAAELEVKADTLAALLTGLPQGLQGVVANAKVRFAVNGSVIAPGTDPATVTLGDGDEVALLPPVSGG
jgi:molybdopterin synthase sulfur carrier subunit